MIAFTKRAADMVRSIVPASSSGPACLRLWATEEEDGALQFHMSLLDCAPEGDQVLVVEGICIAVEPATAQALSDSLIDFDDGEDDGSFRVCPSGEAQSSVTGAWKQPIIA